MKGKTMEADSDRCVLGGERRRCSLCDSTGACVFSGLPIEAKQELTSICQPRFYSRGVTVFWQGDSPEGVLIARSGWLKLSHVSPDGRPVTVDLAGPGSVLCLREVLTGYRHEASGQVLEQCELEFLEKQRFLNLIEKHGQVALNLLRATCRDASRFMSELCMNGARVPAGDRLLRTLLGLASACGRDLDRGVKIRLPLTVREIGERIGCSRQWTTKLLAELEEQEMIQRDGGWIIVTPKALSRCA